MLLRRSLLVCWIGLLAAQLQGCGFLLPDRIHWKVAPDAPRSCQEALPDAATTQIVGVALSGGGSRAAVYAAAGLEALWEHGLLDQVTHLSSVSGGSIAASYFATQRPACEEEPSPDAVDACWRAFFARFKRAMRDDFAWSTTFQQVPFPNRWLSPTRRALSFQQVLDRKFLDGRTFGDLDAVPRPVLLINGASYDEARRFVFSNQCIGGPTGATRSASFSRPGCTAAAPQDLPLSLAVATSAAFPGLFGPVALAVAPSCDVDHPEWWHLGDGGMIDNLGLDTLEELVLEKASARPRTLSTAALLALDAGRVLRTDQLKQLSNYTLLARDPSRIVTLTKSRGEVYHAATWARVKQRLASDGVHADEVELRYMDARLERWPESCWREARRHADLPSQAAPILDRLEEIPTLLRIDDCGADLLERAAHDVIHARLAGDAGHRLRALGIEVREPAH